MEEEWKFKINLRFCIVAFLFENLKNRKWEYSAFESIDFVEGGKLYRKSAQSRVEGERSFRISKNPIVETRARLHVFFQVVAETTCTRVYARKETSFPLSEHQRHPFFPTMVQCAGGSVVETIFNLPFPFTRRRLLVEGNSEN